MIRVRGKKKQTDKTWKRGKRGIFIPQFFIVPSVQGIDKEGEENTVPKEKEKKKKNLSKFLYHID
jgi:hypothetical protein